MFSLLGIVWGLIWGWCPQSRREGYGAFMGLKSGGFSYGKIRLCPEKLLARGSAKKLKLGKELSPLEFIQGKNKGLNGSPVIRCFPRDLGGLTTHVSLSIKKSEGGTFSNPIAASQGLFLAQWIYPFCIAKRGDI